MMSVDIEEFHEVLKRSGLQIKRTVIRARRKPSVRRRYILLYVILHRFCGGL